MQKKKKKRKYKPPVSHLLDEDGNEFHPNKKLRNVDVKKIEAMGKAGCTEKQIASILGIRYKTLWENKKNRKFIGDAIKRGQELGNQVIQRSLFKRAKGFSVDAVHFTAYEGRITRSVYRKYYPPSDIAAFFWLKNKAGWKDKPDDIFDQESVMRLANKLVEIIASEAPNEKTKQTMLSRISDAFEALQATKAKDRFE